MMYYGDLYCYVSSEDSDGLFTIGNEEQRLHWNYCECMVQDPDFCRNCYQSIEEHKENDPQCNTCNVVYYTVYKNPFYREWNTPRNLFPDLYHQIEHHFRVTGQNSCHFWKYGETHDETYESDHESDHGTENPDNA